MSVRDDFPILKKDIVYLDSSCVSLKPQSVIDAMNKYYTEFTACHGRSMHKFATKTTDTYYDAHARVGKLIGAKDKEIVFVRNTTEAINIVANSFGKGDKVITSNLEHNSNFLPWVQGDMEHVIVPVNTDTTFNYEALEEKIDDKTSLVSLVHSSNLTGATLDAKRVAKIAHDHGAKLLLDSAQAVPHHAVDVKKIDADFLAFSGHKMLGPSGTGALYGKKHLLEEMPQYNVGGDTVKLVREDLSIELEDVPMKFEAGLQDYAGALGFAEAADYLRKFGMDNVHKNDVALGAQMRDGLAELGVKVYGENVESGNALFNVEGVNPSDVCIMLDESANVMVRSGMHCCHYFNMSVWHEASGTVRASAYLYNTREDVEKFLAALKTVVGAFK